MSSRPMQYAPDTGRPDPWPDQPEAWRTYMGPVKWTFNPWTGRRRPAPQVQQDPQGRRLQAPAA